MASVSADERAEKKDSLIPAPNLNRASPDRGGRPRPSLMSFSRSCTDEAPLRISPAANCVRDDGPPRQPDDNDCDDDYCPGLVSAQLAMPPSRPQTMLTVLTQNAASRFG